MHISIIVLEVEEVVSDMERNGDGDEEDWSDCTSNASSILCCGTVA